MDELRKDMIHPDHLSKIIVNSINAEDNCVVEEITVRRILGDF